MYLEKLEIQGFKSFANKNQLKFSGPINNNKRGITAIVGPNGSGKSNIADAVRWVLGEQSIKTLRGKKSEDIIFSGSDKKSRLGLAEVSLFLKNNDDQKIKLNPSEEIITTDNSEISPFDYDELIITRRLSRSGDSEYLINNSRVRLTDIQMLLAKANIGQKTYSIIGQGMVENFLNISATERKEFFDEATGIKPFQIKRDSALNKLEKSHDNLNQVDMLLSEIKPRLKMLTRQVERLKKRDRLEIELKNKQKKYYQGQHQEISQQLDKVNVIILELENKQRDTLGKLTKISETNKLLEQSIGNPEEEKWQRELQGQQEEHNQLIKQLAKIQAELSTSLESQGKFDVSWLKQKQAELKTELHRLEELIAHEEPTSWRQQEAELKLRWQDLQQKSVHQEQREQEKITLNQKKDELNRQLAKVEIILETKKNLNNADQAGSLEAKKIELNNLLTEINQALNDLSISEENKKNKTLKQELFTLEIEVKSWQDKLINLNQELKNKANQGLGKSAISETIDQFLNQLEKIEQEKDLATIKKLINQAKTEFSHKISKVMTEAEEPILAQIKTAQEEIIALNEQKQQLSAKLNKNELIIMSQQEKQNYLNAKKIDLENNLQIINNQLKDLAGDSTIQDLINDKQKINNEIIKIEGQLINLQSSTNNNLGQEKQDLLNNLNDCRLKISSQEEKVKLLKHSQENINRELEEIINKITKGEQGLKGETLTIDQQKLESLLTVNQEKLKKTKEALVKINNDKQASNRQLLVNQQQIDELRRLLEGLNSQLHEQQLIIARQETRLEDLENSLKNEGLSLGAVKNFIDEENLQFSPDDLWKKINDLKRQLEQIGGIDPETETEYAETKDRFDFLSQQTTDLRQAINSLEQIINDLDEQIKSRFAKEFKIITEKFSQYFSILFDGGQAKIIKIEESEEEDTEENSGIINNLKRWKKKSALGLSGIDIQATPPGKKIQSIAMLSGGERALTAIALICAIISANPSPFVVLDEVDAALDEANSARLAKILDDLSNQTQFIIITHNRATMRQAEILYGITMQQDGVSRLLSVKLEEAIAAES